MTAPTTKKSSVISAPTPDPFKQYILEEVSFDAYDREEIVKQALGSDRNRRVFEIAELRSANFVQGVSGWRLTPLGLEIQDLTLGDGTVPLSALANITSDRLLGRDTAGSGAVEQLVVGGGIEFSGAGGIQTSAFTGDVTKAAGGTVLTIANDAVIFAKMQNVTTDRLLGRDTIGAGDVEEISVTGGLEFSGSTSIQIANNGVTFAKLQDINTKKLIGRSTAGSGDPEEIDFDSGTYTPTLTNVANLDASTAYECQYMRIGNTVTVSGKVDIDPTLAATSTQLGISLPIASNLGVAEDCAGVAFASGIAGQGAAILGDATNNRAQLQYISGDVTNQSMYFSFTYQVI